MARPRIIRMPEGGEVILKNLLPERQESVVTFLKGEETAAEEPVAEDNGEMLGRAISVYHNPENNVYSLVVVAYNTLTKKAEVVSIKDLGTNKFLTMNEFKKAAVEHNFV